MKTTLIVFLITSAALAQAQTGETRLAPSCGPDEVTFEVETDKSSHPLGQPVAGKALVYFLQDDTESYGQIGPTTRLGVDGGWVGATHGNSYFYFSVDPGEHHLCASWQKGVIVGRSRVAAAHFKAEAGGRHYFRAKNTRLRDLHTTSGISLERLDSDEGRLLVSEFSFSTFHQNK